MEFSRAGADRNARLRLRVNFSGACRGAVFTGAIPLRQAAAGRAAEDMDPNQSGSAGLKTVRSDGACVAGALEKDRHGLEGRFDPALFVSPHKSHGSHRSLAQSGQLIF